MSSGRRSVRPGRGRLALLFAGVLVLTAPAAAWASPADDDSTVKHVAPIASIGASPMEQAQLPLVAASDRIQELVAEHGWSNFAGVAIDINKQEVELYWKGAPPKTLRAELDLPAGVHLAVIPVPYSLVELDREARRIAEQNQDIVASAGVSDDFTGLEVGLDKAVPNVRAATVSSRIPISFTTEKRVEPDHRWDDHSPLWGGSVIRRPVAGGYSYCSTAFGATPLDAATTTVMLTANHCGGNAEWRTPVSNWLYGRSGAGATDLDAVTISGGDYAGNIYTGGPDSNSGVPIYGAGSVAQNSWVFVSGGFSGAGVVQVTRVNIHVNVTDIGTVGPGFETQHPELEPSIGQGDSGGPVAQAVQQGGDIAVWARGLHSATWFSHQGDDCWGVTYAERRCGWRSFQVNITPIMSRFNLKIGNSYPPV